MNELLHNKYLRGLVFAQFISVSLNFMLVFDEP